MKPKFKVRDLIVVPFFILSIFMFLFVALLGGEWTKVSLLQFLEGCMPESNKKQV